MVSDRPSTMLGTFLCRNSFKIHSQTLRMLSLFADEEIETRPKSHSYIFSLPHPLFPLLIYSKMYILLLFSFFSSSFAITSCAITNGHLSNGECPSGSASALFLPMKPSWTLCTIISLCSYDPGVLECWQLLQPPQYLQKLHTQSTEQLLCLNNTATKMGFWLGKLLLRTPLANRYTWYLRMYQELGVISDQWKCLSSSSTALKSIALSNAGHSVCCFATLPTCMHKNHLTIFYFSISPGSFQGS